MRVGAIWGLSLALLGAPTSVHAAPPEGPSESHASLPRYDEAPRAVVPVAPIEVPPTGVGRIAGGSLALAGGTALVVWGSTMISQYSGDPYAVFLEVPVMLVGISLLGTGGTLLGTGIAARRTYREWERDQAPRIVPPRGDGMLGTGVTLLVTGLTVGTVVLVEFRRPEALAHPAPIAVLTTSVVATLGGVGLIVGSTFLRRKHKRWLTPRMTPLVSPLPGARPGIGGLSFGLAGRF